MMRGAHPSLLIFALLAPAQVLAMTPADLTGRWTVTWDNNTRNIISLTAQGERLSGTYTNDAGAMCSVTGNFQAVGTSAAVAFQIVCPQWDVRMEGTPAADGNTIAGTYRAYVQDGGRFSMAKQ